MPSKMAALSWVEPCAEWLEAEAAKNSGVRLHTDDDHIVCESNTIPGLSYAAYIRAVDDAVCYYSLPETSTIWASAMILLKRMSDAQPELITPHTAHRLILTAFVVAIKVVSDQVLPNYVVARLGGVTAENLNGMERMLLRDLDFAVGVSREALLSARGKPWCVLAVVPDAEVTSGAEAHAVPSVHFTADAEDSYCDTSFDTSEGDQSPLSNSSASRASRTLSPLTPTAPAKRGGTLGFLAKRLSAFSGLRKKAAALQQQQQAAAPVPVCAYPGTPESASICRVRSVNAALLSRERALCPC
eukprot:Rhum_TRINITY_DN12176_c0_g1::Rhum_TRINITY_DN12176_c0_g1_i1::g.49969::m.49969